MKQFPVIFLMLVFGIAACHQPAKGRNGVNYKSAVQYNDYIVSRQARLMQNILDFSKAAENDLDSAREILDRSVAATAVSIEEIKGMPAYRGDTALRETAVRTFTFYKKVFEEDYTRIIAIRKKGEEMTPDDMAEMKNIVDKISRDEEGIDRLFHRAQRNFAGSNNMKLTDNDMQKKLEREIGQ